MDLKELNLTTNIQSRHPWEKARVKVVCSLIEKLFHKKDRIVILDIGCGDTWLIEQLSITFKNANFIAVDTAFDKEAIDFYNNKLNSNQFSVYDSLESAFENNHQSIDLILLLDVIEHIENDIDFLKWVCSFKNISDSTKFLITVPAYQSLFSQHDVFLEHYRRYDNKLLKKNIESSNLKALEVGYFFFSLLPPRILTSMKEKVFKPQKSVKGIGGWEKTPLDNFIINLLFIDYKVSALFKRLQIKIPGLSNYAICKKA